MLKVYVFGHRERKRESTRSIDNRKCGPSGGKSRLPPPDHARRQSSRRQASRRRSSRRQRPRRPKFPPASPPQAKFPPARSPTDKVPTPRQNPSRNRRVQAMTDGGDTRGARVFVRAGGQAAPSSGSPPRGLRKHRGCMLGIAPLFNMLQEFLLYANANR